MSTIRDESTRTLAEALGYGDPVVAAEMATGILAASPTLAADLDFATAWRMAKEALPGGYGGPVLYPQRFVGWYATALDERIASSSLAADFSADGPTPTEALVALTAALRDRAR